jgi:ferredoxin-type protein NapH
MKRAHSRLGGRMPYQLLRKISLAMSFGLLLVVPLWNLAAIEDAGAGLVGGGRWAELADRVVPPTIAPPLVGTLWSVDLLGIEVMDPLAGLSLLVTGRADPAILIAVLPAVLAVVVLGRFFCGWLCPYVPLLAASNSIRHVSARLGLRLPDVRLDRRLPFLVLFCVLLITAVGGAVIVPLVYPPAIIGRQLFRAIYFGGLGGGAIVLGLALLIDTFVTRGGFCTYLCPGGAVFRIIGVASPVRVRRDAAICDSCGECDLACSLDQSPMTDRLDSGCERCAKCVAACPCRALQMTTGSPLLSLSARRQAP